MLIIIFILVFLVVFIFGWRYLSRRKVIPCPVCMAWLLDLPLGEKLANNTLDRIGIKPNQRVLEIGPGTGRVLIPAAKRVLPHGEVVGLDIQPGMLKRLQEHAKQSGITNLTAVLGDAREVHFPQESFDVIYLCYVLGEVPDPEIALKQGYVALKKGGRFSVTETIADPHYQTRSRVKRLAEAAGFRLENIYGRWYYFTANFVK